MVLLVLSRRGISGRGNGKVLFPPNVLIFATRKQLRLFSSHRQQRDGFEMSASNLKIFEIYYVL